MYYFFKHSAAFQELDIMTTYIQEGSVERQTVLKINEPSFIRLNDNKIIAIRIGNYIFYPKHENNFDSGFVFQSDKKFNQHGPIVETNHVPDINYNLELHLDKLEYEYWPAMFVGRLNGRTITFRANDYGREINTGAIVPWPNQI